MTKARSAEEQDYRCAETEEGRRGSRTGAGKLRAGEAALASWAASRWALDDLEGDPSILNSAWPS